MKLKYKSTNLVTVESLSQKSGNPHANLAISKNNNVPAAIIEQFTRGLGLVTSGTGRDDPAIIFVRRSAFQFHAALVKVSIEKMEERSVEGSWVVSSRQAIHSVLIVFGDSLRTANGYLFDIGSGKGINRIVQFLFLISRWL